MKRFEFLDITTADVAFIAYGKSLDELFENAAYGMYEVMINLSQVKPKIEKKIEVDGGDMVSLMFNWLNELIFYVDAENLVFSDIKVKVDEGNLRVEAFCRGERIDPKRHETKTHVKACTYHKLEVRKQGNLWKARIILDI